MGSANPLIYLQIKICRDTPIAPLRDSTPYADFPVKKLNDFMD